MPSFMQAFRHHSASGKTSSSNSLSNPTTTSRASVLLHELCERCRKFERECSALNWLQRPHGQTAPSWPVLHLCTVTQLSQSAPICHFCKIVLAKLQHGERGIRPAGDAAVYLCPETKNGTSLLLRLVIEKDKVKSADNGRTFAIFQLQTYDSKFEDTISSVMG
jgi:hypothetical protein